ncbi:hypothetical protein F4804DRAFT_299753 [Jackrogersella minutella]|nr:hypothetical protein F4804DRAFT_299753 [Jackrogersella minutella]
MGWMWSSQSPKDSNPNPSTPAESSKPTEASKPTEPSKPTKQPESNFSDPEIAKFMSQLQAEFGSKSSPKQAQPPPPPPSEASQPAPPQRTTASWKDSLWGSSRSTPEPAPLSSTTAQRSTWTRERLDPITEALLPSTMSCQQAFDLAFHCNSLGGQWTSVYRNGAVRSCSEKWDDFWFCMRTRAYSGPVKEAAVRDYHRRREYDKYFAPGRPSSTDVWQSRDEFLEPGSAFSEPLEMPNMSDEEWQKREIERRRRWQEYLRSQES